MKRLWSVLALSFMVLGVSLLNAGAVTAAEHGGHEHGGGSMDDPSMHSRMGHGMTEDADVLLEAADALWDERPDLAAKLEKIAKKLG